MTEINPKPKKNQSIPLYQVMGAPLSALVQAEAQAIQTTVDFIERIGLYKTECTIRFRESVSFSDEEEIMDGDEILITPSSSKDTFKIICREENALNILEIEIDQNMQGLKDLLVDIKMKDKGIFNKQIHKDVYDFVYDVVNKKNGHTVVNKTPKMFTFSYDSYVNGQKNVHEVNIPLLSIVGLPNIQVKEASFDFSIYLDQHYSNDLDRSHSMNNDLDNKDETRFLDQKTPGISVNYKQRNSAYPMKVKMQVVPNDLPSGLSSFFNLLQQSITQTPVQSNFPELPSSNLKLERDSEKKQIKATWQAIEKASQYYLTWEVGNKKFKSIIESSSTTAFLDIEFNDRFEVCKVVLKALNHLKKVIGISPPATLSALNRPILAAPQLSYNHDKKTINATWYKVEDASQYQAKLNIDDKLIETEKSSSNNAEVSLPDGDITVGDITVKVIAYNDQEKILAESATATIKQLESPKVTLEKDNKDNTGLKVNASWEKINNANTYGFIWILGDQSWTEKETKLINASYNLQKEEKNKSIEIRVSAKNPAYISSSYSQKKLPA